MLAVRAPVKLLGAAICFFVLWKTPNLSPSWNTRKLETGNGQSALKEQHYQPLFHSKIKDPWKKDLFRRLDRIRDKCGPLCAINDEQSLQKYTIARTNDGFSQMKVPLNCRALMLDEDVDVGDKSVPYPPPNELMPFYTMNGLIECHLHKRHVNVYLDGNQTVSKNWTTEYVNNFVNVRSDGSINVRAKFYGRGPELLWTSLSTNLDFKGKRVLVIGSERPWVESICLRLGALHVTTLEYGRIDNHHPNITTLTPSEFREFYRENRIKSFDVVVSFSSLEHPGLGRYGDSLNPWADLLALARAWCVTKPGGYLSIAVPTGKDSISFNSHRIYGSIRYPLLTANWVRVKSGVMPNEMNKFRQPPMIFQKPMDEIRTNIQ